MTEEKWLNLLSMIEENFGQIERRKEELSEEEVSSQKETVEFKGPLGRMKLVRFVRPLLLERKTTYSRRAGSETKIDNVYSEEETVTSLKAYRFDEANDNWQEIDPNAFIRKED